MFVVGLVAATTVEAATISVPAGGNLQAALNAALPGDTILLQQGATYTGNFMLPVKDGATFITLQTSPAGLPVSGARISPADSALLAKLRSPNGAPALRTTPGAHHWRILLLEFLANAGGAGDIIALGDWGPQNSLAAVPYDLVIDRCYIHAAPGLPQKRGIALNSASTAVTSSYIAEIKSDWQDSQAIAGWNGPGPYTIENNYLEAAGENVMFGGGDPAIPNLVPSDIIIRNNVFAKQTVWRSQNWVVKNLFELKNARRVSIRNNVFEYNWQAAQSGFAILFTVRNQDGGCPWCQVEDVSFEDNIVRHVAAGVNILGFDDNYPSLQTRRITIRNNLFLDIDPARWGGNGYFLQLLDGPADVTVDHNTIIQEHAFGVLVADGAPTEGFTFTNNLIQHGTYGIIGTDHGPGLDTIAAYLPEAVVSSNVIAGANPDIYPPANLFPSVEQFRAQFMSYTAGDYRLVPGGTWIGAGTDGRDLGASLDTFASPTISPAWLNFSATKHGAGGALESVTAEQHVQVSFTGSAPDWTASADQPWVHLSNASGSGNGGFAVNIVNPENVLGASTNVSATITVSAPGLGVTTTLPVTLRVHLNPRDSLPPFGFLDTPLEGAADLTGSVAVTGWALDDIGLASVKIYRNCLNIDVPASCQRVGGHNVVFIGNAAFLPGARPDVEALHTTRPLAYRAGWGYLMLTNMLPHIPKRNPAGGGQGTITLYAFATDVEGMHALLGTKTITLNNDNGARPFGAIDTPAQGATVRGTFPNFGWALTPGAATIPRDGSTMRVVLDGMSIGTVTYDQCRLGPTNTPPVGTCQDDIATLFPGFTNIINGSGAIGSFDIDTTTLTNGLHTIAWGVVDDQDRNDGIGSRFFTVSNGSTLVADPTASLVGMTAESLMAAAETLDSRYVVDNGVLGRSGFNFSAPLETIEADDAGVRHVRITELGRLELQFNDHVTAGYLRANGTLRSLPPGSYLNADARQFMWAPGAGYIGTYELVFLHGHAQIAVNVTIEPKRAEIAGRMRGHIDLPAANAVVSGTFTIGGWALDLDAWQGSGVGAVHVWAQRRDVPAAEPIFLGSAAMGALRPDVANAVGPQFDRAGWGLAAPRLERGLYDITAYFWSTRTQRFEDARTVTVSLR